jgi:hypothetical protein
VAGGKPDALLAAAFESQWKGVLGFGFEPRIKGMLGYGDFVGYLGKDGVL